MPFFADAQDTAERYEKYITEFQELFRTSEVSFGTAEDFFRLAPGLARDDVFRERFTALARSVQQRENGRLTVTRMLTIVAIAMGGRGVEKAGDEGAVPVSLLVVFLAGLGGWADADPLTDRDASAGVAAGAAKIESEAGLSEAPIAPPEARTEEEREAAELERKLAADPEETPEATAASLFGGPAQVKEALGRLERNTLQMKMHLDSIDSRIERIEPHLDDLKSRIPAQPEGTSPEAAEEREPVPTPPMKPWPKRGEETPKPEWAASAPPMKPWPSEKERDLVWEPKRPEQSGAPRANWPVKESVPVWREPEGEREPLPDEASGRARALAHGAVPLRITEPVLRPLPDEDLPIRVPFNDYLEQEDAPRGRRWLAALIGALVVALAIAAGAFYRIHGWHGYQDAVDTASAAFARGRTAVSRWTGSPHASQVTPSVQTGNAAAGTSAGSAPPAPGASSPQTPPSSTQATPSPQASVPAAPITQSAARPQPAAPDTTVGRPGRQATSAGNDQQSRLMRNQQRPAVTLLPGSGVASEGPSSPASAQGLHSSVPIFVDEAHLSVISGPLPDFPHDALARGVTGDVVVQAIIARNGDVESAQIVSGTPGLLKASVDAVKQWRFRPYVVNGEPVEARTYVRFRYGTEQ